MSVMDVAYIEATPTDLPDTDTPAPEESPDRPDDPVIDDEDGEP